MAELGGEVAAFMLNIYTAVADKERRMFGERTWGAPAQDRAGLAGREPPRRALLDVGQN
jgi:hypothetical protein